MLFRKFDIFNVKQFTGIRRESWKRSDFVCGKQTSVMLTIATCAIFACPAHAQIKVTNPSHSDQPSNLCVDPNHVLVYSGAVSDKPNVCAILGSSDLTGITVGQQGSEIALNGVDGSATFNGRSTFNGPVTFSGAVNLQNSTIGTTTIVNSGQLTTGGIHVTSGAQFDGPAIFNGAVNSQFLFTGSAQTIQLTATGASRLLGGATISNGVNVTGGTTTDALTARTGLAAATGATVDMGGNRVQNVGAPIAGTDAANKDYVDTAVTGVQGGIATLTAQVSQQDTRLTAVETTNTAQNTRLTTVENVNTVQDTHLAAIDATNVGQDSRLTSVETTNTQQGNQIAAINTLDSQQNAQISTLQSQVSSLQTDVSGIRNDLAGLHLDIRRANAGIAGAVALGGTMVVPDSKLSVSFNLATYRGEQGFSGAVVGRVTPKVYVQAGIAGSTVRGSTAGRVGFSFGL